MSEDHTMNLTQEHEGTEEWVCPTCGRTVLVEWNPFRKREVIAGDVYASHSGSKGIHIITVDVGL